MNQPLGILEYPELGQEFDFDDIAEIPEIDPLEIVLFRFLEADTGDDSFEARMALLTGLLDEYDETDDTFFPPARKVVPSADLRELGVRMRNLKACPAGHNGLAPSTPHRKPSSLLETLRKAAHAVAQSSWR